MDLDTLFAELGIAEPKQDDSIAYIYISENIDAIVDSKYYDSLIGIGWCFDPKHHAAIQATREQKKIYLHIEVAKLAGIWYEGCLVAHKNKNLLDCREENLRLTNNHRKQQNRGKQKGDYTSKYKGVSWHNKAKKWMVTIKTPQKRIYLGLFVNEVDAAEAYNKAAQMYFGEFANLNVI